MDFKIKYFGEEDSNGFPKFDMNVWITESDKEILDVGKEKTHGPQYVKIECKDVLSRFVFYAKLSTINPNRNLDNGYLWIPKDLIHKSWLISHKTSVVVTLINITDAIVADSIVIKLHPEAVKNWSDEEIERAENYSKTSNRIAYDTQILFVKPGTKRVVTGEVESIFPKSEDRQTLYKVTSDTKINFTGLPVNRQKAIDFSQIGGLTDVISRLREIIQIPINYPELLGRFGIKPPKGMLMYGPPGNGKTMIARAVAYSMGSSFITIEGPELMSKYVGVGEQRLREKFEEAESKGNCVIFIDEIDSITSKRSESSAEYQVSIVATLLSLMDGMNSNNKVFVIGATNRLNAIDPALRRPGRFDLEFEVPLPNASARYDILSKYVKLENSHLFNAVSTNSLQVLSELTNGYSGADLSLLYRESVMNAIRKRISIEEDTGKISFHTDPEAIRISNEDFYEALRNITPTSLRGIDINKPTVKWEGLIGLDQPKKEMESIYANISKRLSSKNLSQRPSLLNIILEGIKGAGKRTFIYAFAQQYNYEILELDFWDLASESVNKAYIEINQIIAKAKQIAPTILYLKNTDKIDNAERFLLKLNNELYKLNKHTHIMAILAVENVNNLPQSTLGYKAFNTVINMNQRKEIFIDVLSPFYEKDIILKAMNAPMNSIGQVIVNIQEQMDI